MQPISYVFFVYIHDFSFLFCGFPGLNFLKEFRDKDKEFVTSVENGFHSSAYSVHILPMARENDTFRKSIHTTFHYTLNFS